MKKVLFVFIGMFFVNFLFSQTITEQYIIDGNKRFERKEYFNAIDYYLKAIAQEKDKNSQAEGMKGLERCIEKINPRNSLIVDATKYKQLEKDLEECKSTLKENDSKEELEKLQNQILELAENLANYKNTNQSLTAKNNELELANKRLINNNNELNDKLRRKHWDLTGHYVSFGSGSSYGYFGLNYQYRFGYYALSLGGGFPNIVVGNKCYFSDYLDYWENTYVLLNLGYNQRRIRNTYYDDYYQPTYDYGCVYTSVLVGYNNHWSLDNIGIGFNVGIGFSHYFNSGSSLAYDIGFVLHF